MIRTHWPRFCIHRWLCRCQAVSGGQGVLKDSAKNLLPRGPSLVDNHHPADGLRSSLDSELHGHFRYFLIFSIIKNYFLFLFIKLITYFCTVLFKKPTPSQINLIKNAKNHFLLLKKFKNTESAQLWTHSSVSQRRARGTGAAD